MTELMHSWDPAYSLAQSEDPLCFYPFPLPTSRKGGQGLSLLAFECFFCSSLNPLPTSRKGGQGLSLLAFECFFCSSLNPLPA